MRLARDAREVRGHGHDARAPQREDPVQLGEAQVVADRQPQADAAGGLRHDDLVRRLGALGLAVLDVADHHVEHVDLAVDGLELAVGADVDGRVADALMTLAALRDGAGDEVDPELARERARPADGPAVEGLGAREVVGRRAADVEPLGQDHQLGAVRGRVAHEPLGGREIALGVHRRFELNCGDPHRSSID